jgi:hypothetical protein
MMAQQNLHRLAAVSIAVALIWAAGVVIAQPVIPLQPHVNHVAVGQTLLPTPPPNPPASIPFFLKDKVFPTSGGAIPPTGISGRLFVEATSRGETRLGVEDVSGNRVEISARFPFDVADLEAFLFGATNQPALIRSSGVFAGRGWQRLTEVEAVGSFFTVAESSESSTVSFAIGGVVIEQMGPSRAHPRAELGFLYPLPVRVRSPGAAATELWQGQAVTIAAPEGKHTTVIVAVSRLAGPRGDSRYVFEGVPYTLAVFVLGER